jgi:hypothetical protein
MGSAPLNVLPRRAPSLATTGGGVFLRAAIPAKSAATFNMHEGPDLAESAL